jgi:hypothetical protein
MIKTEMYSWIRKHGLFLILLLAFLFATSLVIEQQQTIQTQQALIRVLYRDSAELSQIKMKQAAVVKH